MRRTLAIAAFVTASATAAALAEGPTPTRLVYLRHPGAESCPDESELLGLVDAKRRVWWARDAQQVAHVDVQRDEKKQWVATFVLQTSGAGSRSRPILYKGTSCDDAIALAASGVALAVGVPPGPPQVRNDSYLLEGQKPLVVSSPGVLANDFDPDSPSKILRTRIATMPKQGSLTLSTNGSFIYVPDLTFDGEDAFRYFVLDEKTYSTEAIVRITAQPTPIPTSAILAVHPAEGEIGKTVTVRVIGSDFPANPVLTFDVESVRVASYHRESSGEIRADVVIGADAPFGPATLTVRDPADASRRASRSFLVTDMRPAIADLVPRRLKADGKEASLTIRGTGFRPDAAVEIDGLGSDIKVLRTIFSNSEEIRVDLRVDARATIGVRPLQVRSVAGHSQSEPFHGLEITQTGTGPVTPPPPQFSVYAGSEGGYSYWSGGRNGSDEHYQASALSGELVAGGDRKLWGAYNFDVLITGYVARKVDRRSFDEEEQAAGNPAEQYATHRIGATALRAAIHSESEETGVSLGVIVGGFQESGCRHDRTGLRNWSTPLCGDYQQWAAFPTFSLRLGPVSGPYATLGFLDGRSLAGSLAHIGAGTALSNGRRAELSVVASTEGVGPRLSMTIPGSGRLVFMPAVSGGVLYDAFVLTDPGHGSFWLRAGLVVGLRQ